jgi:hypothetical protein
MNKSNVNSLPGRKQMASRLLQKLEHAAGLVSKIKGYSIFIQKHLLFRNTPNLQPNFRPLSNHIRQSVRVANRLF